MNTAYGQHCGSAALPPLVAQADVQLLLDPATPGKAAAHLTGCDLAAVPHTAAEAGAAHAWLQQHASDAAPAFFKQAQKVHRWSALFDGAARLPLPPDGDLSERLQALALAPGAAANGKAAQAAEQVMLV